MRKFQAKTSKFLTRASVVEKVECRWQLFLSKVRNYVLSSKNIAPKKKQDLVSLKASYPQRQMGYHVLKPEYFYQATETQMEIEQNITCMKSLETNQPPHQGSQKIANNRIAR